METIVLKMILGGSAACGFAILFNVPKRLLIPIFCMGAVSLLVKTLGLEYFHCNIILVSLLCSSTIGIIGLLISIIKKTPPLILCIPSVIPLVPGVFIYNTMIGIIKLTSVSDETFNVLLLQTIQNGLKSTFILMCLAIGVIIPNLILRKDAFYEGTKDFRK